MRLTDTERAEMDHRIFCDDGMREREGLRAEILPQERAAPPLESRIVGMYGRMAEDDMKTLLAGGSI